MKKIFSVSMFLIFFSFISLGSVNANGVPLVESEETSNSIELSWNLVGENYKIYRDQELVFEGSSRSYLDNNLEADHMYSYRIGTYDENDKLIDITNYKTRTKSEPTQLYNFSSSDDENLNSKLSSTVGMDYVQLAWEHLEDKDGIYEIYRDDQLIGETDKLFFVDETVEPGTTYKYTVEAKKAVSQQKQIEMEEYIKKNNLELSKEEREEIFTQPHLLMRLVETNEMINELELKSKDLPSEILKNEEKARALAAVSPKAIKSTYLFRYTTFIPDPTAKPPLVSTYYKGDNRGFDFWHDSFRTRSDVFAGWVFGNELYMNPYTGITTQYKDGKAYTKQASTSGMKLTKDLVSSTKMMWRVNHDIGDPFLDLFPNINYYYEASLYSNNSFEVRGAHDKAPNHEFYFALAYSDASPGTIFKYTGGSLFNLVPGMPQRYFEFSM